MVNKQDGKIRTKMADALMGAFYKAAARGQKTGKVGHRVLTNIAKDTGVKYDPMRGKRQKAAS